MTYPSKVAIFHTVFCFGWRSAKRFWYRVALGLRSEPLIGCNTSCFKQMLMESSASGPKADFLDSMKTYKMFLLGPALAACEFSADSLKSIFSLVSEPATSCSQVQQAWESSADSLWAWKSTASYCHVLQAWFGGRGRLESNANSLRSSQQGNLIFIW